MEVRGLSPPESSAGPGKKVCVGKVGGWVGGMGWIAFLYSDGRDSSNHPPMHGLQQRVRTACSPSTHPPILLTLITFSLLSRARIILPSKVTSRSFSRVFLAASSLSIVTNQVSFTSLRMLLTTGQPSQEKMA